MKRIKVRLTEDFTGSITLTPVSPRVLRAVEKSNQYDGHGTVFIQEARVEDLVNDLPRSAFYGRGEDKRFNDGAVFLMDEWTFRHMVGGQSD